MTSWKKPQKTLAYKPAESTSAVRGHISVLGIVGLAPIWYDIRLVLIRYFSSFLPFVPFSLQNEKTLHRVTVEKILVRPRHLLSGQRADVLPVPGLVCLRPVGGLPVPVSRRPVQAGICALLLGFYLSVWRVSTGQCFLPSAKSLGRSPWKWDERFPTKAKLLNPESNVKLSGSLVDRASSCPTTSYSRGWRLTSRINGISATSWPSSSSFALCAAGEPGAFLPHL